MATKQVCDAIAAQLSGDIRAVWDGLTIDLRNQWARPVSLKYKTLEQAIKLFTEYAESELADN